MVNKVSGVKTFHTASSARHKIFTNTTTSELIAIFANSEEVPNDSLYSWHIRFHVDMLQIGNEQKKLLTRLYPCMCISVQV